MKIIIENAAVVILPDDATDRTFFTTCPYCGETMDGLVDITSNKPPLPGDFSMCGECGAVSVFDESLSLQRLPSDPPA